MKERIYGIFQRCGAFLIVLCLLIGCFPTNVFATDANINYVSLGIRCPMGTALLDTIRVC